MFELLGVITVFPILLIVLFVGFVVFYVFPKIKNSGKIDKLTDDLIASPGRDKTSSTTMIDKLSEAKQKLSDKKDSLTETIKSKTAESEVIDKVLNPTKN